MASSMYLLFFVSFLVFCQLQRSCAAPGSDDPDPPRQTSTVVIGELTTSAKNTLATTGKLSVVRVNNNFFTPGSYQIPCGDTWLSWWKRNYWYFQCIANMNCEPYWGCWCNACVCYAFVVYPQSPPCRHGGPWYLSASTIRADAYVDSDLTGGR